MVMDLTTRLRASICLSQAFGIIPFEIKESNGKAFFSLSEKRLKIIKINFAFVIVLHAILVVISTDEINSAKDNFYVKIVRFLNLMSFTGGIAVMFLTTLTKGKVMCDGLNEVNELYKWSRPRAGKEYLKSTVGLFLGTVANYLVTVFPLMLIALYVQRYKPYKVISYAYYAFSMWLENVFIYQFVAIVSVVGEAYGCITRIAALPEMPCNQLQWEVKRSRLHEETVKDFVDVIAQVYKLPLFFWIFWSFTMILQFVLKVNLRVRVVIWCLFICYRGITIIYACSIIRHQALKTAENLHGLFIECDDLSVKEEIEIYSYQLLHRKPEFSACGFFNLDFPLFHSMVASVTTYIVVLMQLQGAND